MFCWPSRRSGSSSSSGRKKAKSELSVAGDDADSILTGGSSSLVGSSGILVKPHKSRKKGKKSTATFKCDLSEALLPPSDECLLSLRSASCNSSIRELSGYHQRSCSSSIAGGVVGGGGSVFRGGSNKHFVRSSQHIPNFPGGNTHHHHHRRREEDSDSVNNNNNRSAEVLLFYSNNSLSTRNSVADFIENEEFNYKSLWGKDITEWDSRESRASTLERSKPKDHSNPINTNNLVVTSNAGNNKKTNVVASNNDNNLNNNKTGVVTPTGTDSPSLLNGSSQTTQKLSAAASSPNLNISSSNCHTKGNRNSTKNPKNKRRTIFDDDDEPLPSPPPTPPEAKINLGVSSSLGNCNYFKYPKSTCEDKSGEKCKERVLHSSTSTSSLSSSCIHTPEIEQRSTKTEQSTSESKHRKGSGLLSDCGTQTLPFWQLEFPGILHCSCRPSTSGDSGIILNNLSTSSQQEDSSTSSPSPVAVVVDPISSGRGHESPVGDSSSSGISSSDDNLESLHAEEEIMLKSLKNSFLHQAIPFQLCNFSGDSSSSSDAKSQVAPDNNGNHGGSNNAIVTSQHSHVVKECQSLINGFASSLSKLEKQKVQENNLKNQRQILVPLQQQRSKDKCEFLAESIPNSTVTYNTGWWNFLVV